MGKVCNILNLTEQEKYFQTEYKNLSEKIARDTSKDIYNNLIEKLGLNKYANPDSLAASTFSAIGNIGGIIGLTLLTGGAAGAIFGEATGAAVVATEVANGAIMATSNMGSETERALLNGASMEEASFIGLGSGLIGALTGGLTGKLSNLTRNIGLSEGLTGLGTISKKALTAFGIGASEPIINEIMHTGIYKNDGNFLESLISNIKKDGTIVQSLIGGLGTGGGVLANGLSGIRIFNNNKSISNFNNVLNSADLNNKKIEYNELLDSNLKLKKYLEKINKNTDIDYTVPEDLREDFLKLSILNKEITTGRTIDSDEINILKQNITGTILTPKDIDANKKEITKIFAQNERLRKFEQMILNGDTLVDVPDDLVDDINKIYALIEENKIGVRYNHNVNNRIPKYFTDITQTRALNNDEINARLKIIHQNPELLALIENPDENIIIPEHLQDDYNYLKKLINEINLKETVENPFSRVVLNPNDNYLDYTLDIATAPNDFYQRNLDYFLKKGITYDDYIKATGINIKKYDTSNIISEAVDFNDRSLYLTQKIKEIMNMPGIPDTTKNKLQSFYNTRTKDINLDDLETILKDYIPESELQILHSIKGQELRDVLSLEEQTAIYQYTRAGGGDVCDALRKDNFERLKEIEELMNKYAREHSYNTRTFDNILPDELIGVLSKNTNRETISATRYVNSLSVLISPSSDLNTFNLDELIGKSYTDKALTSFTLVDGIDTTYSKNKIKMHASIDPGCGSLIQNVSGIYSETSEFLTLPGTKTTIIDAYRNIDGSIVLETIVSLID